MAEPTPFPPQDTPPEPQDDFTSTPPDARKTPAEDVFDIVSDTDYFAKKQSHKKAWITVAILGSIVLIGGIAAAVVLWLGNGTLIPSTPSTPDTSDNESVSQTNVAQKFIDEIEISVRAAFADTISDLAIAKNAADAPTVPVKQLEDYGFYVVSGNTTSITASSPSYVASSGSFETTAHTAILDVFDRYATPQIAGEEDALYGYYGDDSFICVVSPLYPVSVTCTNSSDYEETAKAIAPFAALIPNPNGEPGTSPDLVLQNLVIRDSLTPGYQTATLSVHAYQGVGGYAALFYSVDNEWRFFKGTQSILECSDYSTPDLQKAYEGERCYDTTTDNENATVRVVTNAS